MHTDQEDNFGSEDKIPLVDRRNFLRGVAATAAVATVGGPAALITPALAAEGRRKDRDWRKHRDRDASRPTKSASSCSRSVTSSPSTSRARSPRSVRSDTRGSSTRVLSAGPSRSSRRCWTPITSWRRPAMSSFRNLFIPADWSVSLADANTLGSTYIVHPFFGIDFTTGEVTRTSLPWREFAHDLNLAGIMARDAGLKLGYHNHNWEFFRLADDPSRTAFDILVDETDPDLVHLELDLFWATRGARDPVDIIEQNKGRILQYHIKDMNQAGSFTDLGEGLIDFARIFDFSKKAGAVEYIVERDDAGSPPRQPADALTTARVGYEFLSAIRF